ncbi:hypothetical protein [Porticoccus sp.]
MYAKTKDVIRQCADILTEERLAQSLSVVVWGNGVSWEVGFQRGPSIG